MVAALQKKVRELDDASGFDARNKVCLPPPLPPRARLHQCFCIYRAAPKKAFGLSCRCSGARA